MFQMCSFDWILNWMLFNTINYIKWILQTHTVTWNYGCLDYSFFSRFSQIYLALLPLGVADNRHYNHLSARLMIYFNFSARLLTSFDELSIPADGIQVLFDPGQCVLCSWLVVAGSLLVIVTIDILMISLTPICNPICILSNESFEISWATLKYCHIPQEVSRGLHIPTTEQHVHLKGFEKVNGEMQHDTSADILAPEWSYCL